MVFQRNVEFFRVEPSSVDLQQVLSTIYVARNASPETSGLMPIPDSSNPSAYVYLWKFDQGSNYCEGMIVKLRVQDVPKKGDYAHNTVSNFTLEPKTGFAEMSYFAYLPVLKVLALFPGKNGVKSGNFVRYIQTIGAVGDFDLQVMLTKDVQRQIARLRNITRLSWKVNVGNGFPAKSPYIQSRSVKTMLGGEEHPSVTVSQTYGNPKRSGGLPQQIVKTMISTFLRSRKDSEEVNLKTLAVKGSESAEQEEVVIDLLANKYKLKIDLEDGASLEYLECQTKVRRVVLENIPTLTELIGEIR